MPRKQKCGGKPARTQVHGHHMLGTGRPSVVAGEAGDEFSSQDRCDAECKFVAFAVRAGHRVTVHPQASFVWQGTAGRTSETDGVYYSD